MPERMAGLLCERCAKQRPAADVGMVPLWGPEQCTGCQGTIDPKTWPFVWRARDPNEEVVPVVLRRDPPSEGGRVFALFPTIPADDRGCCTCYQHVGQHGAAAYHGCVTRSKPVATTHPDALELLSELTSAPYFYNLRVVKRATRAMHEACRTALRKMNEAAA